jgi:hypothetical protein
MVLEYVKYPDAICLHFVPLFLFQKSSFGIFRIIGSLPVLNGSQVQEL